MDWNRAIEVNRQAVIHVLDEIFALLELALAGTLRHPARGSEHDQICSLLPRCDILIPCPSSKK